MLKSILLSSLLIGTPAIAEDLDLGQLIQLGYEQNPAIKNYQSQIRALEEDSVVSSTLTSPTIGLSELKRGSTTRYWSIAQKIEFPTKYSLRDDIQSQKKIVTEKELAQLKLRIRSRIVTLYYAIYSVKQIISLTEDDLQNVKEFARIAETRYAAGKAAMHEAMKAHVLQTQIEADLISLRQEEESLQSRLQNHLNQPETFRISQVPDTIAIPRVQGSQKELPQRSPLIEQKKAEQETANLQMKLAAWDYAPDFNLRYQGYLSGEPESSHNIAIEMSVPLWFWGKTAAERSAEQSAAAKGYAVETAIQETKTQANELFTKVKSQSELLDIMKSALIPQAQTSFSSTLDAYKASKSTFLELLDAERSLLKAQITYYRMLTQYVENMTALETTLGRSVSELAI